jgi:diaminohydroxyphosphoribosylaminopyrimidine deaminase/5-amino-6-(5-phosphoribosylamino)uracil reductase
MEQAILVGGGTFRTDHPGLDVRDWSGPSPLRIILTSSGSICLEPSNNLNSGVPVIFTHNAGSEFENARIVLLDEKTDSSLQVIKYLYNEGLQSLLVEGGAEVLSHFITTGLWDEARVFTGEKCFGEGLRAPVIAGVYSESTSFSKSRLVNYYRTK